MQFYCWEFNLRKLSNDSTNISTGQNIQVSWIFHLTAWALFLGSQWFLLAQKCTPEMCSRGASPESLCSSFSVCPCVLCSSQEDWNTSAILWELLSIGCTSKALWNQCPELPKITVFEDGGRCLWILTCTIFFG